MDTDNDYNHYEFIAQHFFKYMKSVDINMTKESHFKHRWWSGFIEL